MHFEIKYGKMLPNEIKQMFKRAIEKYGYLVPTWCHVIYVKHEEPDEDQSPAHIEAQEEYREATITISTSILAEDPEERIDRIILHEILHIILDPLATEAQRVISRTIENDKFKSWAERQLEVKEEGVIQDLLRVFRKYPPK